MCVTAEELLDFRVNCQPVSICCPVEEIDLQLEIATEMVKIITGVDWCPETTCKLFNGTGAGKLVFSPRTGDELLDIEEINILKCCGTNVAVDLTKITNHKTFIEYTCDGCFPCGDSNIQVCGSWGRDMPAGIRKAIILLALEAIRPGSSGLYNPNGVRSATWEDFRISYSIEERPRGAVTTGFQEIDDLLVLYTSTASQIGFQVIPESSNCLPRDCGMVRTTKPCCSGRSCGNC